MRKRRVWVRDIFSILSLFLRKEPGKIRAFILRLNTTSREGGQALLEYILLMVVIISILVGSVYQLNDAFRKFTESYFGSYLQCLLEAGELPRLGYEGDGICDSDFEEFSLANGRPPRQSSGANGVGGLGGDGTSGRNATVPRSSSSTGSGAEPSGAGSTTEGSPSASESVGSSVPGQSGEGSRFGRSSRVRSSSAGGRNNNTANNRKPKVPFNPQANTFNDLGSGATSGLRPRVVPIAQSGQDSSEAGESTGTVAAGSLVGSKSGREQKVPVAEKKPQVEEDVAPNFTFGKFLRYFIIICILVALALFIGGQVRSITKSMD